MATPDALEPRFIPVLSFSTPAAALASALYFLSAPCIIYAATRIKSGPPGIDTKSPHINLAIGFGVGRGLAFLLRAVLINHFSTGLLNGAGLPFATAIPGLCIQLTVLTRLWALKAVGLGVELLPGIKSIKAQAGIVNLVFLFYLLFVLGACLPMIIVGSLFVINNPVDTPYHDLGVRLRLACESLLVFTMVSVLLVGWRFTARVRQFDVAKLRQPRPEKPKEKEEKKPKRELRLAAWFKRSYSAPKDAHPVEEHTKLEAVMAGKVDSPADLEAASPLVKIDHFEATTTMMDGLTRMVIPCSLVVLARLIAGLYYLPTDTFIGIYPNEAVWYPFIVGFELIALLLLIHPRSYAYLNLPWLPLVDDDDGADESTKEADDGAASVGTGATVVQARDEDGAR